MDFWKGKAFVFFAFAALAFSLLGCTSSQPTPTPSAVTNPQFAACTAASGTWKDFPDSCADLCSAVGNQNCAQVITPNCDCGPSKCWNGNSCATKPAAAPTAQAVTTAPTVESSTPTPIATVAAPTPASTNRIDDLGKAIENAANGALAAHNSSTTMTLFRMDEVINAGRSVVTRNYYDGQYNGGVKEAGQNNQLRLRIIVRKIYPAEPVLPTYSPTSTKTVAGRQMDVYNNGEQFITSLRCYDGGYYVYVEKNGYSNLKADEIFTVLAAVCPQ